MSAQREKILQRLNPNLLKMTPKLSSSNGSFIDLDAEDSAEAGVKKLMMRFFRNQDLCEKNKRNSVQTKTELIIHSAKYNESDQICELLSERLTLPFTACDEDDVCERPGRRLQKLQTELREKMSAKWEEEYRKRVKETKLCNESKNKCKNKYSTDYADDDVQDTDDCDDDDVHDDDDCNDDDVQDDNCDDDDVQDGDDCDDEDDSNEKKTIEEADGKGTIKEFENGHYDDGDDGDDADNEFEDDDDEEESDNQSVINGEKTEENARDGGQEEDEYENCSLIPAYQPGGGMLHGGSELTQCDEDLPHNLLSPSLRLSLNESSPSATKMSFESIDDLGVKKVDNGSAEKVDKSFNIQSRSVQLFSQNPNASFDLNDAYEFCSGKFPGEQSESRSGVEGIAEGNINGASEDKSDDDDDDDDFRNTFDEENISEDLKSPKVVSKTRKNIIAFEDSEDESKEIVKDVDPDETDQYRNAVPELLSDDGDEDINEKAINKKKTKKKILHFSDEEDATNGREDEEHDSDQSDEAGSSEKENENEDFEEKEIDYDQRSVHYDSEENEIINPKEFFEKEAELSGSEWSGDEDEKGLDEFDVEEGDADVIDNDEVRSQLEKIHIRRVLDDDAREVRFIQEILFEDGDLHSDGKRRDRKFKWKNLGTFDEPDGENGSKEDDGNVSEDNEVEEEEELRKSRYEKELFFMAKKKDNDLSSDDDIIEDFQAVKVTQIKASVKLSSNEHNTIENSKTKTEIFKSTCLSASNSRGSFLTRNEQFLSRLAKAASAITDNVLGPKNSKNFVFTTRSPEKADPGRKAVYKRQVEDVEGCSRREKKPKVLSLETHVKPSILDLLV